MEYYKNLDLQDIVYFCEVDLIEKTEQWKDVVGYEGYYKASDLGRVKSIQRKHVLFDRINNQRINNSGYLTVCLSKNRKYQTKMVHKLVTYAFYGKNKKIVDHKDDFKLNNCLSNLQYLTTRLNTIKYYLNKKGEVGYSYEPERNKYRCSIHINKKRIYLGRFDNKEDCIKLYEKAILNIEKYNGDNDCFRKLLT